MNNFKAANYIEDIISTMKINGEIKDVNQSDYETNSKWFDEVVEETSRASRNIEHDSIKNVSGIAIAD